MWLELRLDHVTPRFLPNLSGGWSCIQSELWDKSAIGWVKDKVTAFSLDSQIGCQVKSLARAGLFPRVYISNYFVSPNFLSVSSLEPFNVSREEPFCGPAGFEAWHKGGLAQWPGPRCSPCRRSSFSRRSRVPVSEMASSPSAWKPPRLSFELYLVVSPFLFLSKHDIHLF